MPDLRGFAHLSHAYQKECLFFQQLAPVVPIQVPKVYGCWTDGSARAEYFVLVLEDLPTHSRVFDQVTDPPDEACARQLVKEPNRFLGLYGAGLAAERAGDRDRARGYFEKLVALCAESDGTRPELVQVRQALAPR